MRKLNSLKLLLSALLLAIGCNVWGEKTYTKVTNASSLSAGDIIILACDTKSTYAGAMGDNAYLSSVSQRSSAIEITLSGNSSGWTLTTSEGTIGATADKKMSKTTGTTTWTITFTDGNAKIVSTNTSYGSIQYNASSPRFLNYSSNQTAIQIYKVSSGSSSAVAPTLTNATAFTTASMDVTITNNESGATVYYTTDGNDPTTGSSSFTGASKTISISGTTTVKAIATISGKDNSSIASATYTKVEPLTTMDDIFAKATAVGSTATDVYVTFNNWIVSGVTGSNAYITDNAGKGFIVFRSSHGFATGDILSGTVACKVQLYNGSSEITALTSSTTGLTVTKGGVVNPVSSIALESLTGVNTGAVLSYDDLLYDGTNFTDGETSLKPYSTFITLPTLIKDKNYDVTGVYIQYNSTKEIAPRTAEDIVLDEKINKYVVTFGETLNGTITVKDGETIINNGNEVEEGKTLTIECTPVNADYRFLNWQYKVGENDWVTSQTNPQDYNMPSSDVQFRANFELIPVYTVAFSVNGAIVKSEDLKEGAAVSIPDVVVPAGITKVFTGWIETATVEGETPAYVTPIETATKAATYYAVYANVSGTPANIEKLNGTHSFAADENIVVVATGTDWAKNMYQETVSTSYVKYENFTNSVDFVSEDNKRYFTLSAGSTTGTWKLGDATNGYVYNESSNDLTVTTASSSNWTIAWNNDKSKFSIKNGNRWLSCRSDLTGANQYKFRGGGTSSASGTVYFDLYLYTAGNEELSDFTTTPGYSLTTEDNNFYSLYLPYEVAIPDGIEAYTGELGNNTLTLTAVEDYIPAETAVLVKSTTYPVTYSFTPSNTGASISATNSLKGVLVDTEYSELYESGETLLTLNTGSNGVGFYKPKEGATTLKANRAYLLVTTQNPAPVRIVMPNDVATAIENNSEAVKANKTLIDGRLYILRDGNMFDLNGRLVK